MKKYLTVISIFIITFGVLRVIPAQAQFGDLFDKLKETVGVSGGLTNDKIIAGLKEALEVSTGNATNLVSQVDGYYKNPKIKIPLPDTLRKAEKALRFAGMGSKLDDFEISMNRAAEKAGPEAKSLFWDAIKQMNFTDARKILNGGENEATLYFKEKTSDQLHDVFKPIIQETMSQVGVTRSFQDINSKIKSMPFLDALSIDLDQYVTDKGLDGLFFMLAEEERKIRTDPAARVTGLLKEVFGSR